MAASVRLAVGNGKGGVAKSSLSTALASVVAEQIATDRRVLLIDLDPQANLADLLGVAKDDPEARQTALRLRQTVTGGGFAPLEVISCAGQHLKGSRRSNLDLIAAHASETSSLRSWMQKNETHGEAGESFAAALDRLVEENDYQLVVIDTPPTSDALAELPGLAMAAADFLVAPTKLDRLSANGLRLVAELYRSVRDGVNPDIRFLGAAVFGVQPRATARNERRVELVEATLAGAAPVFKNWIPHSDAMADLANYGYTPLEFLDLSKSQSQQRIRRLRAKEELGSVGFPAPATVSRAVDGYVALVHEIWDAAVAAQGARL